MTRLPSILVPALLLLLLVPGLGASPVRAAAWLAPGEALTQAHLEALVQPMLPPGERFRISFAQPQLPLRNPARVEAALQLIELRFDPRTERFAGSLHVRLETGEQRVLRLGGEARALVEILVPVRSIQAGERLDGDLLEPLIVARSRLRRDVLVDPEALSGVEARRRLIAGRPVRQADVQEPRLVRRGDTVELVYRSSGLELLTAARALEDGSHGSLVTVANLDSGQRLAGVVTGAGRVAVGLRPGVGR